MLNFFKKYRLSGFSLVETMVGVGLMAGVGLLVTQVAKQGNDVAKSAQQSKTSYDVFSQIQRTLRDRNACLNTFQTQVVSPGATVAIPNIRNGAGTNVFSVGSRFNSEGGAVASAGGSDERPSGLAIRGMSLQRNVTDSTLVVSLDVIQNGKTKNIRKNIILNMDYDENNRFLNCEPSLANDTEDIIDSAVNTICKGPGLTYDSATQRCVANNQFTARTCSNTNESIVAILVDAGTGTYNFVCENSNQMPTNCQNDEFIRKDGEESYSCVKMACGTGGLYQGINQQVSNCVVCSGGSFPIVRANGAYGCTDTNYCQSGSRFTGFTNDGQAICTTLINGTEGRCPNGRLTFGDNGISYECPASCLPSTTACINTTYISNGISCLGTVQPNCDNNANQCAGTTYSASNGCGVCTGTKQPVNGEWTIISESEKRDKPGAVCDYLIFTGDVKISDSLKTMKSAPDQTYQDPCIVNPQGDCVYLTGGGGGSTGGVSGPISTGGYTPVPTTTGSTVGGTTVGGTTGTPVKLKKYMAVEKKVIRQCHNQACGGLPCVGDAEYWTHDSYRECADEPVGCQESADPKHEFDCCDGRRLKEVGKLNSYPIFCPAGSSCICTDILVPAPTTTGSSGGCFIAGSEVTMSDGRQMPIELVLKGDELLDSNGKSNQVQELIRLDYKGNIFGINGSEPFFTPNHPFKTLDGWKSLNPEVTRKEIPEITVKKLELGDVLIKENNSYEILMSLDSKHTNTTVYNFQLSGNKEYLVNEYSVHNKLMCPVAPAIGWNQEYVICQCPEDACPTYIVVPSGGHASCPHCL